MSNADVEQTSEIGGWNRRLYRRGGFDQFVLAGGLALQVVEHEPLHLDLRLGRDGRDIHTWMIALGGRADYP
jgi:hypothetical protein